MQMISVARDRTMMERFSFQFFTGLFVAVLMPSTLVFAVRDLRINEAALNNTMMATAVAFVAGLVMSRRMRGFPGFSRVESDLPLYITTYTAAAVVLLALRVPYSVVVMVSSFSLASLMAMVFATSLGRGRRPTFRLVPYGNIDRLASIEWARFVPMDNPQFDPKKCADGLVADLRADLPDEWERALADAALHGCPVYHSKQVEEVLTGKVDIEHLSENSLGSLLPNRAFGDVKSLVDRVTALLVLPLLLPILLGTALAIRLDSPGPVFFRQPRIGQGGKIFIVYKFRSMRDRHDRSDEKQASITAAGDDRITRVGAVIRRFRIDELPQLFNVLRGEMSWVGPRPEAIALSHWYEAELPFYSYRHIVKPGITGWAQVNQGHVADLNSVHDKLRFDFYYIKNFSLWLDLLILLRTVRIVTGGFGVK
ncbi:sugar transferase [Tsuneonella sp. HG094]